MGLDTRYIPITGLWEIFTDKNLLTFLANGYVKFWIDTERTVGNPVYQVTGTPPNYTYIQYGFTDTDGGWRIDLNQQGAFDSTPYFFPYDSNGNVQLYFVQVYSSDAVVSPILQFTREGIPNVASSSPSGMTEVLVNYVPNPQFLLHQNIPATPTTIAGQVTQPTTNIAWGGWTYERPNSSTATDIITFQRFGSDVTNPEKSPRYSLRFQCENASSGDTFKDICLEFTDVNKFSSSTQYFTYSFYAQINSGSSLPASIILYKNYGTGGSTPTEIVLSNISIGTIWSLYTVSFIFGLNTTQTIGTLNDDYLQLIVRLPLDSIFDVSFDCFNLAEGQITSPSMPYTADSQMIYRSLAGFLPLPDPTGNDLYLPTILTPTGLIYDHSVVGIISSYPSLTPPLGYLSCNGTSYLNSAYSMEGIPYSRLGNVLWDSTNNFYKFGTGTNFVSTFPVYGVPQNIRMSTNTNGAVTVTSDGTIATGFTFNTIKIGNSYNMFGYNTINGIMVQMNQIGVFTPPNAGTSGFTISAYRNTANIYGIVNIQNITSASGLAGKYFTISNPTTNYYVWFKVDGAGSDPAPGGTGIEIDLLSSYDIPDVQKSIADALSGKQISNILCTAGSSITAGSYFTFNTITQGYYVWYTVNGAGTDPGVPARTGIKINILNTDTNTTVSSKTWTTINRYQYAVPDSRGMFQRAIDNGANIDPSIGSRFNQFSDSYGDLIGTIELDDIIEHYHNFNIYNSSSGPPNNVQATINTVLSATLATANTGIAESRPINMYFNFIIKY